MSLPLSGSYISDEIRMNLLHLGKRYMEKVVRDIMIKRRPPLPREGGWDSLLGKIHLKKIEIC